MANVDWAFVAVIIALLAYPLQVLELPSFQRWVTRYIHHLARWVWLSNRDCQSLELEHFPPGPFHRHDPFLDKCESLCTEESFKSCLASRRWSDSLELFFPLAWDPKRTVPKPSVLPFAKKYIRVDVEVLLVYVHLVKTTERTPMYPRTDRTKWVEEILDMEQCGNILIARRRPTILNHVLKEYSRFHGYMSRISGWMIKSHLRKETCDGQQLKLLNGLNIPHPLARPSASRRGGWILALGMSHSCLFFPDLTPSKLLPFVLRGKLVKLPFTPTWVTLDIANALSRVRDTIEFRLLPAFPESAEVKSAVDLLQKFYKDYTYCQHYGSGSKLSRYELFKPMGTVAIRVDYMKDSDIELCAKIVEMFDSQENLTDEEKALFVDHLPNICRCAIKGMVMVVEYYRHGTHLVEPDVLKSYTHVYLEEDLAME